MPGNYPRLTREGEKAEEVSKRKSNPVVLRASSQEIMNSNLSVPRIKGNSNSNQAGTNFKALIEDIGKEILKEGHVSGPIVTEIINDDGEGKSSSSLSSRPYNVNLSWNSNSWNIEYHEVLRLQIWILRESLVQACEVV